MFEALRSMADRYMVDTCTIRAAGTVVFDEDDGEDVETDGDTVYSGKCWVRPLSGDRMIVVGAAQTSERSFLVRLPWDTTGVQVDMIVTVDDSGDPHLIGRRLRVTDVSGGSENPDRVLICEDTLTVSVPEEVGS